MVNLWLVIAMKKIDMSTYPRIDHFTYFKAMAYPYVGLTVNVDVTALVAYAKEHQQSFFLSMLYCVGNAANSVPEFRQRIIDNEIVEYDHCITSHTVMKEDGTYAYCEANPTLQFQEFLQKTAISQALAATSGNVQEESDPASLYFISCIPWLSYTALVQPVPNPADSNPRITWGKYEKQGSSFILPVSVLAHHALVDGIHIAKFYEALNQMIQRIGI